MNQPNPTPPKSDEWNEDHVCPTCRIGVKYINKDLTEVELTMKTPRYVTDEEIDAMFPYLLVGSVREQTKWNEMQEMRRIGAKAMRDKILTYVSELEQLRQPTVISCVCPNEIKTGTVSIDCCNLCGKPDEDWWSKHCL